MQCAHSFAEECQFLDPNESNQFGADEDEHESEFRSDDEVNADSSVIKNLISISVATTKIIVQGGEATVFVKLRRSALKGHIGDYVLTDIPRAHGNSAQQWETVALALDNHLIVAEFSRAELMASRTGTWLF